MKLHIFSLPILLSFVISPALYAQFEGEIEYRIYNPAEIENKEKSLSLTFTKDRLFIQSDDNVDVMNGVSTNGILIRSDLQDFVLLTSPDEAVKVAKSDLDGLVSMMNRFRESPEKTENKPFEWDEKVIETGRIRTLNGYRTKEFTLMGGEDYDIISVWLTDEIKADWGLLMQTWYDTGVTELGENIPVELVMNKNSFPLLVEVMKENRIIFSAEATNVNNTTFDRSVTEVSDTIKLLSFSDVMMNMFRQRK
ncbi:MAG: hypothetical protein WD008_05960 [Balneolaceae bacterium]